MNTWLTFFARNSKMANSVALKSMFVLSQEISCSFMLIYSLLTQIESWFEIVCESFILLKTEFVRAINIFGEKGFVM